VTLAPSPRGTVRILIADDHRLFAESLARSLELDQRIEVVGQARNGAEAVLLVDELEPDVVLMDLQMPVLDGVEATRQLLAAHPATTVLVLTGSDSPDQITRASAAGAAGYVTKDRTTEELTDTLFGLASLVAAFG
jgi:DNA-binding NarL/FixJ family response regulator